jgi:hypothetical protein
MTRHFNNQIIHPRQIPTTYKITIAATYVSDLTQNNTLAHHIKLWSGCCTCGAKANASSRMRDRSEAGGRSSLRRFVEHSTREAKEHVAAACSLLRRPAVELATRRGSEVVAATSDSKAREELAVEGCSPWLSS